MKTSLSVFAPENLVSRDEFGSSVPRQPAYLHLQAESSAQLRGSSRVLRWCPIIYFKPPYAIGSVPSLSGHAACTNNSALVFHVGNHDVLRVALVYQSLENCRVRLCSCKREFLASAAVRKAKPSCVQLSLISKLNNARLPLSDYCSKYNILYKKTKRLLHMYM